MDYDLNYQEDTGDVNVEAIPNKIGDICQDTGTYECTTCGEEIEVEKAKPFPNCANCGDSYLTWNLLKAA